MKRKLPLLIVGFGVFLIVGGFFYDVMFAGIPYQDPTPKMAARYAQHSHIASTVCLVGGGIFLVGAIAGVAQFITGRSLQRQDS